MSKRPELPRGAGLFGPETPEPAPAKKSHAAYRANIDGGSRGNPGAAAYGVVVRDPKGDIVAQLKKYIGQATNNVAEYFGLIAALDYAEAHNIRALRIESDSELLVKQMRGVYKVKSEDLRPLFERARKMAQGFESFHIHHVYREQNREADALVNQALDETSGAPSKTAQAHDQPRQSDVPLRFFAKFEKGMIRPLRDLDLPEGAEVEVMLRLRK